MLDECLSYNVTNIRSAAVAALPSFFNQYYKGDNGDCLQRQSKIIKDYLHALESETCQITRMGHALGLGVLPNFMLKINLDEIINSLIKSTCITMETLKWAESRRDSIKALTSICLTLEMEIDTGMIKIVCTWRKEFEKSLSNTKICF